MSAFGDNVKRIRMQKHLSQEELAKKTGYTDRSSISYIESGKRDCSHRQICAIANALGVSPGELLETNNPYIVGTETKRIITQISNEIGEDYNKLEKMFLEKPFPRDISYKALLYFFSVYLNKPLCVITACVKDTLNEQEFLAIYNKLNAEGQNRVEDYMKNLLISGKFNREEEVFFRAAKSEDNHPAEITTLTAEEKERIAHATRITAENEDF